MHRLQIRLPDQPKAAAEARRAMARLAEHLQPDVFDDVRFLVNELVTNSVKYGQDGIQLRAIISEGVVRVEVSDGGPGFQPAVEEPGTDQTSGRGLFLVEHIADRWGVDARDPTRVWFEIDCLRQERRR